MNLDRASLERELAYHEKLYSGFAQQHFAKPAVRAMRKHLVARILRLTGAGPESTVLSLGCGIGDTELLLAPSVRHITGIDVSPKAVAQANEDARRLGIANVSFVEGGEPPAGAQYDLIIAVFFLHHLPDDPLAALPRRLRSFLKPEAWFYSLDPSRARLSGAVGRILVPSLMKRYQTEDERELDGASTAALFRDAGYQVRCSYYDFASTPLAGLFPAWSAGYRVARRVDDWLLRSRAVARFGSNFELLARAA